MRLPNPLCVGIDVSKATLDIAATAEIEQFTTSNDSDGFDEIINKLKECRISLVLMEATGGFEAAIACSLQAAGFDVTVINPSRQPDGCGLSWPEITVIKTDNVIVFQVVKWPVQLNPVNENLPHNEANFPAMS